MIDLHTHTNFSDGTDTPAQLITKAMANGITTLAITDHDSIGGWEEAKMALRPGLSLVLGAEISCQTVDGISVHILGLLFNPVFTSKRHEALDPSGYFLAKFDAEGIVVAVEKK